MAQATAGTPLHGCDYIRIEHKGLQGYVRLFARPHRIRSDWMLFAECNFSSTTFSAVHMFFCLEASQTTAFFTSPVPTCLSVFLSCAFLPTQAHCSYVLHNAS